MELIDRLRQDYPDLIFSPGPSNCWSPHDGHISYSPPSKTAPDNAESLLHELAHARLGHADYINDLDLLQKEVEAWDEALRVAVQYGKTLDHSHIQDCLDTYRDWLHKRSVCPDCASTGLQENARQYVCFNCGATWQVTIARFTRPYRRLRTKPI